MYNPSCTEWSVNGYSIKVLHRSDRDEDCADILPNFFDADFNIATSTGFTRVWEGSVIFRDYINKVMQQQQQQQQEGRGAAVEKKGEDAPFNLINSNCIELGSGCGMFGLNLAAIGANVLLTDVASVTRDSTAINVAYNSRGRVGEQQQQAKEVEGEEKEETGRRREGEGAEAKKKVSPTTSFFVPSVEAHYVGDGTAAAAPIDWNKPLSDLITAACAKMDYLIGCECVWVPDLLAPFAATLARCLLAAPKHAKALVCYPVRGVKANSYFTNQKQFEEACEREGLVLTMLLFTPKDASVKDSLDVCIYSIVHKDQQLR